MIFGTDTRQKAVTFDGAKHWKTFKTFLSSNIITAQLCNSVIAALIVQCEGEI